MDFALYLVSHSPCNPGIVNCVPCMSNFLKDVEASGILLDNNLEVMLGIMNEVCA